MDYDSARHHFEALQTAKKKDETKIAKVKQAEGCAAILLFWEVCLCLLSRFYLHLYLFTGSVFIESFRLEWTFKIIEVS